MLIDLGDFLTLLLLNFNLKTQRSKIKNHFEIPMLLSPLFTQNDHLGQNQYKATKYFEEQSLIKDR